MTRVRVLAPAKINLTLHVTGQREDGYHTLDSLVAFSPVGDLLDITTGNTLSLTVDGPEAAGVPADMSNLAMKAAALVDPEADVALSLSKYLPAASGIGGGSSDAAAAFRGMLARLDDARFQRFAENDWAAVETLVRSMAGLGADIPMCLRPSPLRAQGIGDELSFVSIPSFYAVLVNPRVPVSTPDVFRALEQRTNPPMQDDEIKFSERSDFLDWLAMQRNDLQNPAISVEPLIGDVLEALEKTADCHFVRMSGSGATCFGLFLSPDAAAQAAEFLRRRHPNWWVEPTWIGDCWELSRPQISNQD